MPLMFRKVYKLGPIHWNFGRHGLSSWSIKIGKWSWNSRTRAQRVDLPGPLSWRGRGRSRSSRSAP